MIAFSPQSFAESTPERFIITGSGFGHGVGMSQMGAKGLALEGKSAVEIAQYFFPGTTVSQQQITNTIRVNIAHAATYISISATGPLQLRKSNGDANMVSTNTSLKFVSVGKVVSPSIVTKGSPTVVIPSAPLYTLTWDSPTVVSAITQTGAIKLAYGFLSVRNVNSKLEVTTNLKLDTEYLYGIGEMSSTWPTAALQAQAIASRTYGLARMNGIKKDCDCNLYATKYDQVFTGYAKESEKKIGSLWKSAVDSTSGQVITFNGQPINVYFSSSSGGITQSSADVWGTAFPYLTNVPDPWSLDIVLNPTYAHWQRVISQSEMASAFSLTDIQKVVIDKLSSAQAALTLTAISSGGTSKTLSVSDFKVKLKLPSSWFAIN